MTDYKIEIKDKIKLKDKIVSITKKVDDFLDELIKIFLSFVREWFKVLGWVLITSGFLYIAYRFKFPASQIAFQISFLFIILYITFRIERKLRESSLFQKIIKNIFLEFFIKFIFFPIVGILGYLYLIELIFELVFGKQ